MATKNVRAGEAYGILATVILFGILVGLTAFWSMINLPYASYMGWGGLTTGIAGGLAIAYIGITRDYGRYDVITGLIIIGYILGLIFEAQIPVGTALFKIAIYGGVFGLLTYGGVWFILFMGTYEVYSTVKLKRIG